MIFEDGVFTRKFRESAIPKIWYRMLPAATIHPPGEEQRQRQQNQHRLDRNRTNQKHRTFSKESFQMHLPRTRRSTASIFVEAQAIWQDPDLLLRVSLCQLDALPARPVAAAFRAAAYANPITWQVDVLRYATIGLGDASQVALESMAFLVFTAASFAAAVHALRNQE